MAEPYLTATLTPVAAVRTGENSYLADQDLKPLHFWNRIGTLEHLISAVLQGKPAETDDYDMLSSKYVTFLGFDVAVMPPP